MRLLCSAIAIALAARPASARQPATSSLELHSPADAPLLPEQGDPAEERYREGINQLNNGAPGIAAGIFQDLVTRYPNSKYVLEALYWRAFALARKGERDNNMEDFRQGLAAIREMHRKFRKAFSRGDGPALEQRILGQMAQRGDEEAARSVAKQGQSAAQNSASQTNANCEMDTDGAQSADVKIAALNALARMNAAQAVPTLQKIVRQHDKSSVCLRRAAIFLLSQQRVDGVEATLLNAARLDPDLEVRKGAVLYLSQFTTDQAMYALDSIVRETRDSALVSTAVLALAQSSDPRAKGVLVTYAERDDLPKEVQRQIVLQLLQSDQAPNVAFLQRIYRRLDPKDLGVRREILQRVFGRSYGDTAVGHWYFGIARDNSEAPELRIEALTRGAQIAPIESRMKIYSPTLDRNLREQLIEAYASNEHVQQDRNAVLDDLGEIARRDPDSALRLKVLSRISSSGNPHAAEVLQNIISHP